MATKINKLFTMLSLLVLLISTVAADFSNSQASLHPRFPGSGPFIIEISGTWPNDCHPGEQKPVVESFDGHTVNIGFETIIVHITCNTVDTNYRVLVDMSETIRTNQPTGELLTVQLSFSGSGLQQTLELVCQEEGGCAGFTADEQRPEQGLYDAPALANQGLLLTRQNGAMGIFPLVYDESGRGEWLFSGNHMTGDSFFTEILRPGGGDCFGCEPTGTVPELAVIGHLSMLVERPGVLQVKLNDGLFMEYRRLVFGYKSYQLGPVNVPPLIDLQGRWGISENHGTNPPLGDLTEFLPAAFDITLEGVVLSGEAMPPVGQVGYLVTTLTGQTRGQLVCAGQVDTDGLTNICEFIDPTDAAEPLLLFKQSGPSSLLIEFGRPVIAVGIAPGGMATRMD